MGSSYLLGILVALFSALNAGRSRCEKAFPTLPVLPGVAALCIVLCILFAGELAIINGATHNTRHLPAYVRSLPIPTIQTGVAHLEDVDAQRSLYIEGISILESVVLFALAALLRGTPQDTRTLHAIIVVTAVTLAMLALRAPSMLCSDLYLYIGLAQASPNAYHPDHRPFTGDLAVINTIWGLPLFPSAYGPLWIALSKLAIAAAPTLAAKLLALRIVEAIALALCIIFLILLGQSSRVVALLAVNPAVYDLYISEGHNDLTGVALVLAAALARRTSPILAIGLVCAAGAIKLPFILIGALAFTAEQTPVRRIVFWLTSAGTAVTVCFLAGGPWYAWALKRAYAIYAQVYKQQPLPIDIILHAVLASIAVGTLVLALAQQRFISGAAWSMPALAPYIPASYIAWSFPYALLAQEANLPFFILLPTTVYILNTDYTITPYFILLRAVLIAGLTVGIVFALLRRPINREAFRNTDAT